MSNYGRCPNGDCPTRYEVGTNIYKCNDCGKRFCDHCAEHIDQEDLLQTAGRLIITLGIVPAPDDTCCPSCQCNNVKVIGEIIESDNGDDDEDDD